MDDTTHASLHVRLAMVKTLKEIVDHATAHACMKNVAAWSPGALERIPISLSEPRRIRQAIPHLLHHPCRDLYPVPEEGIAFLSQR